MTWLKTQLDVVIFIVLAALFLIWPEIDLWISGLFYNPEQREPAALEGAVFGLGAI